jgi:hypothetical protein
MKKFNKPSRLKLNHETVKLLKIEELKHLAGGAPVTTHDLPCIEHTLFDCP